MSLILYAHPFSSYCQKALMALWEKEVAFVYRHLEEEDVAGELAAIWPMRRFPVLVDDGKVIAESSIIIEYLDMRDEAADRLIPAAAQDALDVRFMDRFFDQYVMTPMQSAVVVALKQDAQRTTEAVEDAGRALETAYAWLESRLAEKTWAAGEDFTMADCAAAPSLFFADWVHPISDLYPTVRAYRSRLLARPSFARAVEEARPYRHYFPLGAPDRD